MAKNNFKAIGSSILKDVLDSPEPGYKKADTAQNNNASNVDLHKAGSVNNVSENEDVRLHVYISQELENRLLDEVYQRKRNKNIPKRQASKRSVLEDALDAFLP